MSICRIMHKQGFPHYLEHVGQGGTNWVHPHQGAFLGGLLYLGRDIWSLSAAVVVVTSNLHDYWLFLHKRRNKSCFFFSVGCHAAKVRQTTRNFSITPSQMSQIMPLSKCHGFRQPLVDFSLWNILESHWLLQDISTKGSSACGPGAEGSTREASEVWGRRRGAVCLQEAASLQIALSWWRGREISHKSREIEEEGEGGRVPSHTKAGREGLKAIISHHRAHVGLNTGFKVAPQIPQSLEIMRFKRCRRRHESFSGCRWRNGLRKWLKHARYRSIRPPWLPLVPWPQRHLPGWMSAPLHREAADGGDWPEKREHETGPIMKYGRVPTRTR